jgi:hypothetical protein
MRVEAKIPPWGGWGWAGRLFVLTKGAGEALSSCALAPMGGEPKALRRLPALANRP